MACFAFSSCDKENSDNPLVGEWSATRGIEVTASTTIPLEQVVAHYTFREDGTYSLVLPAWAERRNGTYTIEDNKVNFIVTSLEWVIIRENGYADVYDQYGVEDMEGWIEAWPEDAAYSSTFSITDGVLSFDEPLLGLDLRFINDPDFDAPEACAYHNQF